MFHNSAMFTFLIIFILSSEQINLIYDMQLLAY